MTAVAMPLTEAALAARWGAGEFVGRWLRTAAGDALMVLFAGRPGGPSGPDFRDAVLARPDGARLYGDVELHLRARGWQAHGHASDPHYARVVLHVVARADGAQATRLVSGQWAALVELGVAPAPPHTGAASASVPPWPCAEPGRSLSPPELAGLLQQADRQRFAQHTAASSGTQGLVGARRIACCSRRWPKGSRTAAIARRCGGPESGWRPAAPRRRCYARCHAYPCSMRHGWKAC